jgi:hypothetical protein
MQPPHQLSCSFPPATSLHPIYYLLLLFIIIIQIINNKRRKNTLQKVGAGIGELEAQCGLAISQAFAVEAQAKVGRPSIAALIN